MLLVAANLAEKFPQSKNNHPEGGWGGGKEGEGGGEGNNNNHNNSPVNQKRINIPQGEYT